MYTLYKFIYLLVSFIYKLKPLRYRLDKAFSKLKELINDY